MSESKLVTVGTATAIRFAELSAFARDLEHACDALERARTFAAPRTFEEDLLWSHLVSAGVISYWRSFPTLDDKPSLASSLTLSEKQRIEHERSKHWRNRVIAHTDSATKRSLAFVKLVKSGDRIEVSPAIGISVEIAVPDDVVGGFAELVEAVRDQVDDLLNEVGNRLAAELSPSDLAALWVRPDNETKVDESALAWDPTKKRLSSFVRRSIPLDPQK